MPSINESQLTGKIKQLYVDFNLEFKVTEKLTTALKWIEQISHNVDNAVSVDIETSGFDALRDELLGIGIAFSLKDAVYINTRNMSRQDKVAIIKKINDMENELVYHNTFFDSSFVGISEGIKLRYNHDTLVLAYCLYTDRVYKKEKNKSVDGTGIGLKDLTRDMTPFGDYEEELNEYKTNYCRENKVKKTDFSYDLIPDDILAPYCCMDVIATLYLYNKFRKEILIQKKNGWEKLESLVNIKTKITDLYIDAKINGFPIDAEYMNKLKTEWEEESKLKLKELMQMKEIKQALKVIRRDALKKAQDKRKSLMPLSRCRKLWNELEFNFNSSIHKSILFFDVLGLEVIKKTKKGKPSIDAEVMEHYLKKGLDFMQVLGDYLQVEKGLTFINGIESHITDEHLIVHSNHNHCGTSSSRTTTSNINLAQVPSKEGELKKIKSIYKVNEGRKLIGFDYKSAELYIATAISNEQNYHNIINEGLDLHSSNALAFEDRMEELPKGLSHEEKLKFIEDNYKDTWRFKAKALGFGLLYGTTEFGLSKQLNCSKKEAKETIELFLNKNKGIKEYIDNTKDFVAKYGYVENYFGQRVRLDNAKGYNWRRSNKPNYSAESELRFSINTKIQSANAFILYEGMIRFFDKVKEADLDIKLITTIYDAVYLDVNENIPSELVAKMLRDSFEVEFLGLEMKIDVSESRDRTWKDWEGRKL